VRVAAGAAIILLVACPGDPPREICGNGIDDDGNGQIDCADIDCAGHDGCPPYDAGYFGPCPKCGTACTVQKDCIAGDWSSDQPLPDCVSGKCQALNQHVQLRLTLNMSAYSGVTIGSASEATHFVSKTARDGSAVSCATLTALATPDAGALVIEERGTFDVLGFDSEPVTQVPPMLTFPFINTGTGSDFLVWIELWSSTRDSNPPHEPTGRRYNPGCIETGAQVAPIIPADDCAGSDAGTCRTLSFTMPAPM
jgi:hypothetical protein